MDTFSAISSLLNLFGVWPISNSLFNIDNSFGEVLLLFLLANGALSIDGSCDGNVTGE